MKKNNKKRNVVADNGIPEVMRNQAQNSYEQAFLQMDIEQKRGSKSIYLSPEYHERLTRIVQIIGNDKIPLFAYLNNILEHHFNVYEDAITKEFKEKYKGLF
ncbi:DUF3408 domain-containing protein [Chryseobacterium scophthalmum]|uniref:DUF3408 domain-containing protein n=1 Tax=Chryseobacterium scophthalmum TaxID=59733 RepID=A0A1N6FPF4_9FLAO|nr:DUF3408 domain-containing protein [Chryseobacterium scophthalmum]SIN97091.1 Protein of unknown function [Chryseobacterium scophthalmum]